MSDKILPATDKQVAKWRDGLRIQRLVARIEADRATIRAKDEEIERLRKVRTGSAVNRLHNLCDGFEEMDKRQEALIAELVTALEKSAKTFRAYAGKHYAKLTPEGHEKGSQNLYYAEEIEIVLAKAKEAGQ